MKSFNWEKMGKTPEGRLIKSEGGRSRENLVEAFGVQAESDLNKHNRYTDLLRDVEKRHKELVPEDEGAEGVIEELIRQHERTLRNDKGLEDTEEQKAYITALVREIRKRKEKMH